MANSVTSSPKRELPPNDITRPEGPAGLVMTAEPTPPESPVTPARAFLPSGAVRPQRSAGLIAATEGLTFDYPVTQVGVVGNITVYYATSLGASGQTQAEQMLGEVIGPYCDMEGFFATNGGPLNVIVAPLSALNDGSGGAYHHGCDFNSGGSLYLDATFANKTENPLELEVCLYVAELSECFMGAQDKGWGCGSSNGEALSRYMAERETAPGTLPQWGITGPSWVSAGYPDWIDTTEGTDRDYKSIGCGILYIYWMRSLGYSAIQITQGAGATLADNYKTLTGKTTAYADLKAAVAGKTVTSDNPFDSPAGSWHQNPIGSTSGAPQSAGDPSGYMFPAQATQHVNYRGTNNHVAELWWNGIWHFNDLTTAASGAPNAASNPHGYIFNAQGTQHVNFLGPDAHVHELWWDSGGWHHNDLTAAAGAPNGVGNPRGYMFDAQGTQHVNYMGTDNHVHELWWDGSWHHNDLTVAAGAPNCIGDPAGYMFNAQGTQHVNYRGADNHVHELWWDGSWHHNDLTAAAGAPVAAGNPVGYVFEDQRTQHVNYLGADGHVHELWWDGSWHHNDLTVAAGAQNAVSNPVGYAFELQGTQHVNYRGSDSHVHELWWDSNGWHLNDLTTASGAPANATDNPKGYMFAQQDTQHVLYAGGDKLIHELWWG
jgi:hypothetical protein